MEANIKRLEVVHSWMPSFCRAESELEEVSRHKTLGMGMVKGWSNLNSGSSCIGGCLFWLAFPREKSVQISQG